MSMGAARPAFFRGSLLLSIGCLVTALACLLWSQQTGRPVLTLQSSQTTSYLSFISRELAKPCLCAKGDPILESDRDLESAQGGHGAAFNPAFLNPQEDTLPPWVTPLPRDPDTYTGKIPAVQVAKICLVSERVSGSNWLTNTLKTNFPGQVSLNCASFKHWFQSPLALRKNLKDDTIFIVNFRNAVDWMFHLWKKPWNSGSHQNLTLPEFLTKTWKADSLFGDDEDDETEAEEQKRRRMFEFVEDYDKFKDHYEDYYQYFGGDFPQGPIDNIMQLRAMKIDNFLRIKDWIPTLEAEESPRVLYVRYEDLVANGGMGMLNFIKGLKSHYKFVAASEEDVAINSYKGKTTGPEVNVTELEVEQIYYTKKTKGTELTRDVKEIMLGGLHFEQERKLGYHYEFLLDRNEATRF